MERKKIDKVEHTRVSLDKYVKYLIIFLLVFIPSRNVLELWIGTPVKIIPDLMILILAMAFAIYKKGRIQVQKYDIFMLLFLCIAFINTVLIQKISLFIYVYEVRSIMVYYVLFMVVRNFEYEEKFILLLTRILRYITYVLFVLGLVEKFSDKMLLFPSSVAEGIMYADNYVRVYSMFFNPNTYGAFLVLAFFVVLYYEKGQQNIMYKIITVASLLLSMSRSSILIFVIGILIYGWLFERNQIFTKKMIMQVVLIAVAGLAVYMACEKVTDLIHMWSDEGDGDRTSVFDRFNDLNGDKIVENSNTDGRLYYLKTGLQVFREAPVLGTGFGTYGSAASMNWEPPLYEKYNLKYGFYSDNEYIKDLVETGIVGVICLGLFCIDLLYHNKKNYFAVFMCTIVAWFGLFYNVLEVQIVAFLFWSVLGICRAENRQISVGNE